MSERRPVPNMSDRSVQSDLMEIVSLFRSDPPTLVQDQSDRSAPFQQAGPTGPRRPPASRTESRPQNQTGPAGPTGPIRVREESGARLSTPAAPQTEDDHFDVFEERAAIRQYEGGASRAESEAAAIEDVAGRARLRPERLRAKWAEHPDALCYRAMLAERGPIGIEAAAVALGWPLSRAWKAEARLRAAGLVQFEDRRRQDRRRGETAGLSAPVNRPNSIGRRE